MRAIQRLASRLWPAGWHPGGIGWAASRGNLAPQVVLFGHNDSLSGWAGAGPESEEIMIQVDPARPEVAAAALEWCLATSSEPLLAIEVAATDETLAGIVTGAGFVADESPGAGDGLRLSVEALLPSPPDGYEMRSVREDETAARIEVHRAAWKPADLPTPEPDPDVDPNATSPFNADAYAKVREAWLYDSAFDIVAVAPDGTLAGCCISWFDPASGVAEIEPLGVVPARRRLGVAGAMCHEVARRVRAAGGKEVFINVAVDLDYPASSGAYLKAGFKLFKRVDVYRLQR
ncbi:MAG TPA: GNAT family N-acetyltransferase [Acidimicrobiales bacterium]|nr:GNAT family N-acetyltransferase [Acidimicrobiales bacterium]